MDITMLQMTGRIDRVKTEQKTWSGGSFTETTLFVADWGSTSYVTLGRDFGDAPEEGANVVLSVSPRPYINKAGEPRVGWVASSYTLADSPAKRVASVS